MNKIHYKHIDYSADVFSADTFSVDTFEDAMCCLTDIIDIIHEHGSLCVADYYNMFDTSLSTYRGIKYGWTDPKGIAIKLVDGNRWAICMPEAHYL